MDDPDEIERFHDRCSDLLVALAAAPDHPRPFPEIEDALAWPRRRIAACSAASGTCATPSSAAASPIASWTTTGRSPVAGRCGWTAPKRRPCALRNDDNPGLAQTSVLHLRIRAPSGSPSVTATPAAACPRAFEACAGRWTSATRPAITEQGMVVFREMSRPAVKSRAARLCCSGWNETATPLLLVVAEG